MKHVLRALVVVCLGVSATASATTVRLLTEDEMVQAAAAIVRGHVLDVQVRRNQAGSILTDVTIGVDRSLKGAQGQSRVVLTQLGGTLGEQTLHVPGTNTYKVGEEVLVFLEKGGSGLVEMAVGAGKYEIARNASQVSVTRKLGRLAFARVKDGKTSMAPPPAVSGPESLEGFEKRILRQLGK